MRRGANTFPSHNRLPNPRFGCETPSCPFLFSGLLRAFPFPPLGWITHGGDSSVIFFRRLFFSHTVFFRLRQLATLLGTLRSWPLAGPSSLSESLLAFVVCLFIGCSCFCTVIYLPALPYCIMYISLLYLLAGYGCLVIFVRWVLYPNSSALKIGEWHSPVNLCGVFLSELTCKPIHLVEVMLRSIMSHKLFVVRHSFFQYRP